MPSENTCASVAVELPYAYTREQSGTIKIGNSILADAIADAISGQRVWVVCDVAVWALYADELRRGLSASDRFAVLTLEAGERVKSRDQWWHIVEWLQAHGARRRDPILAVGGSTISDVVGFAAATYLRGVPYLNVPTTLLAQVDGSVGGKVAINTVAAKNSIGAFHHPVQVIADVATLATLPQAELVAGLAESIKVSLAAADARLFTAIELAAEELPRLSSEALIEIVGRSVELKLDLLRDDPFENDLQRFLNFGHTVGHAVESATGYAQYRHGEAVAIGMAAALRVGVELGITDLELVGRHGRLLDRLRLPAHVDGVAPQAVIAALEGIRLVRNGCLQMVIPVNFGEYRIVEDVAANIIEQALT